MFRTFTVLALAASLSACGSMNFGPAPAPKVGKLQLVELVPGSIGLQWRDLDCAGKASIVFTDEAGQLHTTVQPRKDYCRAKPGDKVLYVERPKGVFELLPVAKYPAGLFQ